MEIMQQMFRYITSRTDTLIMLWVRNQGWKIATNRCNILQDADISKVDLFHITDWVAREDISHFTIFLNQLKAAMEGRPCGISEDEEKVSVPVRLRRQDGIYIHYNIDCWLEREQGQIVRIFVMIEPLEAKEIQRIRIAETFTSDRDPSIIQTQAIDLIKANPDKKFAVVQFDVAKFKLINEIYGEEKGTELLNFFTSSLKVICNKYQIYSRLSADVYMIVTAYDTEQSIYDLIERLDYTLLGYHDMEYRLVYGVCYIGDLTGGLRQYGDAAAMARQSIKEQALEHIAFYQDQIKRTMSNSKFLEDNMKRALKNGEFVMFLQPKCNISDGTIVGAEALVRWLHPQKGIIPPNDFVPMFEKNGFIIKMDQYIWEQACICIRRWIDKKIEPVAISINVSRKHLKNTKFVQFLNELVVKYDIPKQYLEIEITETVEEEEIADGVAMLKENGFTLLMDDFGAGYSSLNTLKNTQFDVIKIDRGFLHDFIESDRGQKIVEHTIKMTRAIGLDIVAEGVESEEQAAFLENCGCNTAQGFYYARPMQVEEFDEIYMKRSVCL